MDRHKKLMLREKRAKTIRLGQDEERLTTNTTTVISEEFAETMKAATNDIATLQSSMTAVEENVDHLVSDLRKR